MSKYVLLIFGGEPNGLTEGSAEENAEYDRWHAHADHLREEGVFVSGEAMDRPRTATTVSTRAGQRVVDEGPFVDTKDWLRGYYVIDVADLEAANAHAAEMPNIAFGGTVEVRPVMIFG